MRTETIKILKFDELSDKAKEVARNWYRESSSDDQWWDCVFEDSKEVAKLIGIDIVDIYFSGFSSQGDGACFTGSYKYLKGSVKSVKDYAPNEQEVHRIALALQKAQQPYLYQLEATSTHYGRYNHSGCMNVEVSHSESLYRDIGDSEDDIRTALRDFADWIYKKLEDDYNYQNADDQVDESITANEYEFHEDGTRY